MTGTVPSTFQLLYIYIYIIYVHDYIYILISEILGGNLDDAEELLLFVHLGRMK